MRRRAWAVAMAVGCGAMGHAGAAPAQGGSAEAEELFRQGRAALEAKDYATACTRFGASLALERAVGTLISLAQCEEATGHLAGARQHWQEAADLADATRDRLNRGPVARKKVGELDPRVPRITVRLVHGAPADTSIKRDDVPLGTGAFDVALPVDPGAHVIVATAAGRQERTYAVSVATGDKLVVEVEPGAEVVAAAAVGALPAGGVKVEGEGGRSLKTEAPASGGGGGSGGGGRRVAEVVIGGVGIVAIGVGSYFGASAMNKWSSAQKDCGGGCANGSPARNEQHDATTDATLADVLLGAGAVAVAAAVVLLVTGAAGAETTGEVEIRPVVGAMGGGVVAVGSF